MHAIASMLRQAGRQAGRISLPFRRFRKEEATAQGPQRASARQLFVCPKEMAEGGRMR